VTSRRLASVVLAMLAATTLLADEDWPQILGPTRDGVYAGPPLAAGWPATGPRVVWKKTVGPGFSGPIVTNGRVILFHRIGTHEVVESMSADTGTTVWRYDYPTTYRDDFGFDEGPRAVPVVAGDAIYTFGAEGQLHAIDFATGKRLWSEDTMRRFKVPKNFFGAGGSPLVEGGRVIANIGGPQAGIVAFDARTGTVQWQATTDGASYSSGIGATIGGRRTAIFFTRNGLVGLDATTGAVRFQQPWRSRSAASVNAATPLVIGDEIFVSAEYGPGAGVLRASDDTLTKVWASDEALSTHYATAVHRDGILYGYHGRQEFGPSLRAVELSTGKVRWTVEQFRAGSMTLAGNRLLIVRESGELVMADATPEAYRPIARAQVLPATVRALPALSDGFLYVRNEQTLVCLDLRPQSARPADIGGVSSALLQSNGRRGTEIPRLEFLHFRGAEAPRYVRDEPSQSPRAMLDTATSHFVAGRITESVSWFDRLAATHPSLAPQLWQRGIALYYAGRYQDCRAQFESHRTVNPDDVENAAWHFLCVARAESLQAAVSRLLPVGPDRRVPMREVYEMLRGRLTEDQVLAAAGRDMTAEFYAHLYVGLYAEAKGDAERARQHIAMASDERFGAAGGYMHDVARVHVRSR
jgi:outer membrane protein assembly factor BamB